MKTLGIFFVILMFQNVLAQDLRMNTYIRNGRGGLAQNPQSQSVMDIPLVPNVPTNIEDLIEYHEHKLLNTDSTLPTINWPAFPRIWATRFENRPKEVDVNIGPNLAGNGVRATFSYRYGVKSTLWLISSTRPLPGYENATNSNANNFGFNEANDLLVSGPTPTKVYPNVRPGFPVVALCIYEINLTMSTGLKGSLEAMFGGGSTSFGIEQGGSFSTWSNFFNTERNTPIDKYLSIDCNDYFESNVKEYTERNFNRIKLNMLAEYHPDNKCSLSDQRTAAGDDSCLSWHAKFSRGTRASTVPRCEMHDSVSRCVLKSKRQSECTLWHDSNNRLVDENPDNRFRQATRGFREKSCDYGLQCRMNNEEPRNNFERLRAAIGFKPSASCE